MRVKFWSDSFKSEACFAFDEYLNTACLQTSLKIDFVANQGQILFRQNQIRRICLRLIKHKKRQFYIQPSNLILRSESNSGQTKNKYDAYFSQTLVTFDSL